MQIFNEVRADRILSVLQKQRPVQLALNDRMCGAVRSRVIEDVKVAGPVQGKMADGAVCVSQVRRRPVVRSRDLCGMDGEVQSGTMVNCIADARHRSRIQRFVIKKQIRPLQSQVKKARRLFCCCALPLRETP